MAHMLCVTITLNAAIDATYTIDRFARGMVNRVFRKTMVPGGKGNNVARVLAALGHSVTTSGFIAGTSGTFIEQELRATPNVATSFARVAGESRTCLTLLEQDTRSVSELLEPGVEVLDADAERFLAEVGTTAIGADVVVLAGSLPHGLPADYYAQLLAALRPICTWLVLDTSGDALKFGLAGQPHLIKPNAAEMATLMGKEATVQEMVNFAQQELIGPVLDQNAQVLLSLGAQGAAIIGQRTAWLAQPPAITVVNPVGAGDALLAGFVDAKSRQYDDVAALTQAVATGTAAALQPLAGVIVPADIERVSPHVQISTL
jgi:1-phosphofructokinase family hexose kinase